MKTYFLAPTVSIFPLNESQVQIEVILLNIFREIFNSLLPVDQMHSPFLLSAAELA